MNEFDSTLKLLLYVGMYASILLVGVGLGAAAIVGFVLYSINKRANQFAKDITAQVEDQQRGEEWKKIKTEQEQADLDWLRKQLDE